MHALKAARRDAIANFKCFGAPGHQWPNFDDCIYIHYAAPPYSARISSIYLLPFGNIWLGSVCWPSCTTPGNEATQNLRRMGKNSGPNLSRLWTKFHEILRQCRGLVVLSNDLDWLSMACFVQEDTFAIMSRTLRKTETDVYKVFCLPVFGRDHPMTPTFLLQIVSSIYRPPFGKVRLSSVCWPPPAKP